MIGPPLAAPLPGPRLWLLVVAPKGLASGWCASPRADQLDLKLKPLARIGM
jgi:hypothetical protein